jgi:uncharacterized membrane protein YciS (DUF1049 family)
MSLLTTLVALAVLFALGVVVGMISAAGAYAHLERRLAAAIRALEDIARNAPGAGSSMAGDALEDDDRLRRERVPRALD